MNLLISGIVAPKYALYGRATALPYRAVRTSFKISGVGLSNQKVTVYAPHDITKDVISISAGYEGGVPSGTIEIYGTLPLGTTIQVYVGGKILEGYVTGIDTDANGISRITIGPQPIETEVGVSKPETPGQVPGQTQPGVPGRTRPTRERTAKPTIQDLRYTRVIGTTGRLVYFTDGIMLKFKLVYTPLTCYGYSVCPRRQASFDMTCLEFLEAYAIEFGVVPDILQQAQEEDVIYSDADSTVIGLDTKVDAETGGPGTNGPNTNVPRVLVGLGISQYRDLIISANRRIAHGGIVRITQDGVTTETAGVAEGVEGIEGVAAQRQAYTGVIVNYETYRIKYPESRTVTRVEQWETRRTEEKITYLGDIVYYRTMRTYDALDNTLIESVVEQFISDVPIWFVELFGRVVTGLFTGGSYAISQIKRIVSETYTVIDNNHLVKRRDTTVIVTAIEPETFFVHEQLAATLTSLLIDYRNGQAEYYDYISATETYKPSGRAAIVTKKEYTLGYKLEPELVHYETRTEYERRKPNLAEWEYVFDRRSVLYGSGDSYYEYNASFIDSDRQAIECAKRLYERLTTNSTSMPDKRKPVRNDPISNEKTILTVDALKEAKSPGDVINALVPIFRDHGIVGLYRIYGRVVAEIPTEWIRRTVRTFISRTRSIMLRGLRYNVIELDVDIAGIVPVMADRIQYFISATERRTSATVKDYELKLGV